MELINSKSPEVLAFIRKLEELSEAIKREFESRPRTLNGERYLTNTEMCRKLHVSNRTLQLYRNTGKIGYIQISGKILYRESEVLRMLEENYYGPFCT